jgi:hypothetical protein
VARDPDNGVVYPETADGEAAFLVIKRHPEDAHASRAICGFPPHLLTLESQKQLVRHVLVNEMGLGATRP